MEKLWTTAEAAQHLGITNADVEELVRQGTLTGYRLGGRFLRFRPDQVSGLKGQLGIKPNTGKPAAARRGAWFQTLQDFLYFNDFYLVSATCLAVLIVYLIASSS